MASNESSSDMLETINPADLVLPTTDQPLPNEIDINLLCTEQAAMPSDPIWINPAPAQIPHQQEQHLPYTGWEQMTPNGDLNYSSYGSSPVDNTLEYQLMVQRFGHYDLGMARGRSFEKQGLSRATSFSSFEQHPHSPASHLRQRRRKRGRLLADMSSPGPETVYEDSDSHHSWTAADNVETWSTHLRERLSEFRRNTQRISIITSHLQTRQRRKVHSMANLLGLSHTSLGNGRKKRVLICKSELTKSRAQMIEKRWNPSRNNWAPGLVDPRIVLFDVISPKLNIARLQECLSETGLPLPVRLTIDYFWPVKSCLLQPVATAFAMFESADDAALVLLTLDGTKPNWNGLDAELECDHVHFPPGFDLSAANLEGFNSLPDTLRIERARIRESKIFSTFSTSACYSDSESNSEFSTGQPTRSRNTSSSSIWSHNTRLDPGYVSATSPFHSDHSTHSYSHKKRKRAPKISNGYACTFQGCERVFDRDGDRRKHEKNHTAERPHACPKCKKTFLFPKDLRRHMIVHSITSLPSENENEGGMAEEREMIGMDEVARENTQMNKGLPVLSSSPPIFEERLRRLHGESRPLNRRISSISSGT